MFWEKNKPPMKNLQDFQKEAAQTTVAVRNEEAIAMIKVIGLNDATSKEEFLKKFFLNVGSDELLTKRVIAYGRLCAAGLIGEEKEFLVPKNGAIFLAHLEAP